MITITRFSSLGIVIYLFCLHIKCILSHEILIVLMLKEIFGMNCAFGDRVTSHGTK